MSVSSERMAAERHPWLKTFECDPEQAFGDLLLGYADIYPYERTDAPDSARNLFGALDHCDNARTALGPAILAWLETRRKEPLPAAPPKLQRRARELCETFEIVSLLNVADAAADLRRRFVIWNDRAARLALSPARDARAEYWRMLALTQPLVARTAPGIATDSLAPMWLRICREAGGRLPRHYLSIGLLGLRRLPEASASELPWVSGLAQWALAQQPSNAEFRAEWLALKPLYPRAPRHWRNLVARLLSAPTFGGEGADASEYWKTDADLAPLFRATFVSPGDRLRSPMPHDCDRVVANFGNAFQVVDPQIDDLLRRHRRYLDATGDSQFFVRAVHAVGSALIRGTDDDPHARAQKAQSLAREGLKWEPFNPYLWTLWRDALVADGTPEAAELVGWELVRRIPTDMNARHQLATLLAVEMNRLSDAEAILREAIKVSSSPYSYAQLSEVLIAEDRPTDAAEVLDHALAAEIRSATIYAVRARIYANEGKLEPARMAIRSGLELEPSHEVLRHMNLQLLHGDIPSLKSQIFRDRSIRRNDVEPNSSRLSDLEFVEMERFGRTRQLRFHLESGDGNERAKAVDRLRRLFREDPTFAYAELLAARHRIWEANADFLPSVAAAFEDALATEDREKLERLALRQPRLQALILVARAVLGDQEAAKDVALWLGAQDIKDTEPAIIGLHTALRSVLRMTGEDHAIEDVLQKKHEAVIKLLHDANEATLGETLLAA